MKQIKFKLFTILFFSLLLFFGCTNEKDISKKEVEVIKKESKQEEVINNLQPEKLNITEQKVPIRYVPEYEHQIHAYCDQCGADISGNAEEHILISQSRGWGCKTFHYEELEIYIGDRPIYE